MNIGKSKRALAGPLRGESIILREPVTADFREFAALVKANRAFFHGLVPPFNGRKRFNEWTTRCQYDDYFGFLICRRADGAIVGKVNVFNIIRRGLQSGCVGYMLGKKFTRNGYATEAVKLMLRFAFRHPPFLSP